MGYPTEPNSRAVKVFNQSNICWHYTHSFIHTDSRIHSPTHTQWPRLSQSQNWLDKFLHSFCRVVSFEYCLITKHCSLPLICCLLFFLYWFAKVSHWLIDLIFIWYLHVCVCAKQYLNYTFWLIDWKMEKWKKESKRMIPTFSTATKWIDSKMDFHFVWLSTWKWFSNVFVIWPSHQTRRFKTRSSRCIISFHSHLVFHFISHHTTAPWVHHSTARGAGPREEGFHGPFHHRK